MANKTCLTVDKVTEVSYSVIDKIRQANLKKPFDSIIIKINRDGYLGLWLSNFLDVPVFYFHDTNFQEIVVCENTLLVIDSIIIGTEINDVINLCPSIKAVASIVFKAEAMKIEGIEYYYGMLVSANDYVIYPWGKKDGL